MRPYEGARVWKDLKGRGPIPGMIGEDPESTARRATKSYSDSIDEEWVDARMRTDTTRETRMPRATHVRCLLELIDGKLVPHLASPRVPPAEKVEGECDPNGWCPPTSYDLSCKTTNLRSKARGGGS